MHTTRAVWNTSVLKMRQEKVVRTTSDGCIRNALKLFCIYLCLCNTLQLSWSPLAFCRPYSVLLESLLRARTAILVDCWMYNSAEVAFDGKQNPCLGGVFWVFVLVCFPHWLCKLSGESWGAVEIRQNFCDLIWEQLACNSVQFIWALSDLLFKEK